MNRTEAGRSPELDRYLARLEAELRAVPPAERQEILLETRSHVLERTSRVPSLTVGDVLAELGSPEAYARQFLKEDAPVRERESAPLAQRPGALHGLARLATGRWTTLPLFLVVLAGYAVATFAFVFAAAKILEPNATGLFVDYVDGRRSVMLVWSDPTPDGRDVLGWWLVPIALGISATIHLILSALLRRVLRNDVRGR